MLLFLCSILVATAAGVTAFLLLVSGDFSKFRESFSVSQGKSKKRKQLPVITRDGQIIDTREELEAQLELLQYNLEKKKSELDSSRSRIFETASNLQRLKNTSAEIKKYYMRLTGEVQKYENDCQQLQQEIDDYKRTKFEMEAKRLSEDSLDVTLSKLDFDGNMIPPPAEATVTTQPVKTQSLP